MINNITKLISLVHKLPINKIDIAIEAINIILEAQEQFDINQDESGLNRENMGNDDSECTCNDIKKAPDDVTNTDKTSKSTDKPKVIPCPHCQSDEILRFGKMGGKHRFKCKACKKTFITTTHTGIQGSRYGEAVWKQLIEDTIDGTSLIKTSEKLKISRHTVFIMRHKILMALEDKNDREPVVLNGVCELDETYVLESLKGTPIPSDYWRKARKHGARAQKPGLSKEYVCCCTGIQRDGGAIAKAVNRAVPSSENIKEVFGDRLEEGAHILYDGLRSYKSLGSACKCSMTDVFELKNREDSDKTFNHINYTNAFHSQIKERYLTGYRAVATKYLNRYNVLFAEIFRGEYDLVEYLYGLLISREKGLHVDCKAVKNRNLLNVGEVIN
jgi:transposase-like protein